MTEPFDAILILITVPTQDVGTAIAQALVEERLAACVNLLPGITSTFRWEGKVQVESEALLLVKSGRGLFEALAARIRALHPYTVPEIIALPIVVGNPLYLSWIKDSISP